MKPINMSRVILGGIVAGIIYFVLEGVLNGVVLKDAWEVWKEHASRVTQLPFHHTSLAFWFAESMVLGFTGVCIYAGIRPRYGAGPKTAVCAGMTLWAASCLAGFFDLQGMGVIPMRIAMTNLVGGLVIILVSILAGAFLYKEN